MPVLVNKKLLNQKMENYSQPELQVYVACLHSVLMLSMICGKNQYIKLCLLNYFCVSGFLVNRC